MKTRKKLAALCMILVLGLKLSGIWKQHTLLCSIYPVLDLAFILIHSKGWFGYSNRIDQLF